MQTPANIRRMGASLLALAVGLVHAETALERRIRVEPAPHTLAPASGTKVLAHYATLNAYLEGQPRNAQRLVDMKNAVDYCLKNPNPLAMPTVPPTEWPDYLMGWRSHVYMTERFRITYTHNWTYAGPMPNCSLRESDAYVAVLESMAGICNIDLVRKTASGQCNMAAHRAAKLIPAVLRSAGPVQVIAGLRCSVDSLMGTDQCIATEGRMKSTFFLTLSSWSDYGLHEKAESAALDMEVNESIFSPHLQAGFQVSDKPR